MPYNNIKTMKKFLLFIFSTLMCVNINAQVIDKQAEKILDELSKKMQALNGMQINFTYIMENEKEKIKESKKGTILIQGDKYRLTIDEQLVISDGKNVWTYLKSANEVQINEIDPEDENTPIKLLTGYSKNFIPKFIRETTKQGRIVQILDLRPVKPQSFFRVRLEIDKARNTLLSSSIHEKNGTIFSYVIDRLVENPPIPANSFTFNPREFPGITVTDMR